MPVAKVDRDVAINIHVCCKSLFHLFFRCMLHMFHICCKCFYLDIAYVLQWLFKCFKCICKCFRLMFRVFYLSLDARCICFKTRSGVVHVAMTYHSHLLQLLVRCARVWEAEGWSVVRLQTIKKILLLN
jgi:hypothetical protein